MKDYRGWVTSRSTTFVRAPQPTTLQPHLGTFSRSRKPLALHPHTSPTLLSIQTLHFPSCCCCWCCCREWSWPPHPGWCCPTWRAGMAIFRSCLIAAENASNYPNDSIPPRHSWSYSVHTHTYRNTLEVESQSMQFWRSGTSEMCKRATSVGQTSCDPFCIAASRTGCNCDCILSHHRGASKTQVTSCKLMCAVGRTDTAKQQVQWIMWVWRKERVIRRWVSGECVGKSSFLWLSRCGYWVQCLLWRCDVRWAFGNWMVVHCRYIKDNK